MIELVVNELSFRNLDDSSRCAAPDPAVAREWMAQFIEVLVALRRGGCNGPLRVPSAFHAQELAASYALINWLSDGRTDHDKRRYWLREVTRYPLLDNLPDSLGYEAKFEGHKAEGLLAAHLTNGLALSWASHSRWSKQVLGIVLSSLGADADVQTEIVSVRSASTARHVQAEHATWIEARRRTVADGGRDLYQRRSALLPLLEFCDKAVSQLEDLDHRYFHKVSECLFDLNRACEIWEPPGQFPHDTLRTRPTRESQETMKQYGDFRTFRCSGNVTVFEWHMKLMGFNQRIYYRPVSASRRVFIGYIGKHLPTVQNPTP